MSDEKPKDEKPKMTYNQAVAEAIRIWNATPVSELENGLAGARMVPVPNEGAQKLLDAMANYIAARKKAGKIDKAEDGFFLDVL